MAYTPALIKQPSESRLYTMEFAPLLDSGESLSSVTGVTVDPSGPTLSGEAVSGTRCTVRIAGGTAGTRYTVTFVVVTSGGNTLESEGELDVKEL